MILEKPEPGGRSLPVEEIQADLVVAGGGLAGTCAAIAAAREGLSVVLVQDRPSLGGNASSEVRLWILGATSHMGNNNRWAREGGIINEILQENLFRNRHGNPYILETILLEMCLAEPRLRLLLDTAVHDLEKCGPDMIAALHAFCPQNSTRYRLAAPLFCDASGDGVVGFMAGAAFRMGAESREEFGELFAPDETYGQLLGHSMYFYAKDTGAPVKYVAPAWALKDITKIPRYRQFRTNVHGCQLWWLEYGGRLDTIRQSQDIKFELWRVIYGVWNHIKNSGEFPDARNLTLEWVGQIPGKRESRRFEGNYILRQQDIIERRVFPDAVAHGGWAIDLHPADGLYSDLPGCNQWHSKGVYGIPWRCYYSRNISNLFLTGRIISASHVAFGSSRVMATCAAGGMAVGVGAALCIEKGIMPAGAGRGEELAEFQRRLVRSGQFLPGVEVPDPDDAAQKSQVSASSRLLLGKLPADGPWQALDSSRAMLLPLSSGGPPAVTFFIEAAEPTTVRIEIWSTSRAGEFTPDELLEAQEVGVAARPGELTARFTRKISRNGYHFVRIRENPAVRVRLSEQRVSGVLALSSDFNSAVATSSLQNPPAGCGVERFEFWLPKRRPNGHNLALRIEPPLDAFVPENVIRGAARPTHLPNCWIADPADPAPELWLDWPEAVLIRRVITEFDPDWDDPLESVLRTHPDEVAPFMVRDFDLLDGSGAVIREVRGHRQARFDWRPEKVITTRRLGLRVLATHGAPAAVFRLRCLA